MPAADGRERVVCAYYRAFRMSFTCLLSGLFRRVLRPLCAYIPLRAFRIFRKLP